eukprot:1542388-Pleurochrysis_carterae.AAC.2
MEEAVRTRKIDASEISVERETLDKRLAALVTEAAAPCMQTAGTVLAQLVRVHCRPSATHRNRQLRKTIEVAVRTCKIHAFEGVVALQTLAQRFPALVADAVATSRKHSRMQLRMAMKTAVRTRKIYASERLVELETINERPAALIADAAASRMQTTRYERQFARLASLEPHATLALRDVNELVAGYARGDSAAYVENELMESLVDLETSASAVQPSAPMPS